MSPLTTMTQTNTAPHSQHRTMLVVVAFALALGISSKIYEELYMPYGPALNIPVSDRPVYSPVDRSNKSLQMSSGKLRKIYERHDDAQSPKLLKGPETVIFDPKGTMYVLTEDSKLVSLTDFQEEELSSSVVTTAKVTLAMDLGNGRPLGGAFASDGTLYFADSILGLARVNLNKKQSRKVEIVASSVQLQDGSMSKILFADDADIGPKTGYVYFSDATDIVSPRMIKEMSWDVMHASKIDFARGKRTGRLLRYDPKTDEVVVLASGLWFANGIAVDRDETFVMISETFTARQMIYYLEGPKAGTMEPLLNSTTHPDGAFCSKTEDIPYCYAALPTAQPLAVAIMFSLPSFIERPLRSLLMSMHPKLAPPTKPYGGFIEIDVSDRSIKRVIQDPSGQDIRAITGVTVHEDKIYLGSLENDFIGVYDLN
mmetsp:Transcript_17326/g.26485  ORF Transcript_17326/g.26485 Transcript_17326/m.26485 type:complete len:428 (+) Transcript_17326:41-1324(+)